MFLTPHIGCICHVTLLIAQIREKSDTQDVQNIKKGKHPTSIESLASTLSS